MASVNLFKELHCLIPWGVTKANLSVSTFMWVQILSLMLSTSALRSWACASRILSNGVETWDDMLT